MKPEFVAELVLGRESYLAMQHARISWPRICQQVAIDLFVHKDTWSGSEYDMYCNSIREEMLRLGH